MNRTTLWRVATVAVAALAWSGGAVAENWPQFRGLNSSGVVAQGTSPPIEFGPDTNLVWKTDVPPGHSSPCIWDNRVFLTALDEKQQLVTLCIDRQSGALLWTKVAPAERIEKLNPLNSPASGTPATDGKHVYVYFGSYGLLCYDFDGNEVWQHPLPPLMTLEGAGTSPVVVAGAVVVNCDSTGASKTDGKGEPIRDKDGKFVFEGNAYTIAVDAATGSTLWKNDRPLLFGAGIATPVHRREGDVDELILVGAGRIAALDVKDGRERWWVEGMPMSTVPTPVIYNDALYLAVMGGAANIRIVPIAPLAEFLADHDKNADGKIALGEIPRDLLLFTRDSGFRDFSLRTFMRRQDQNKDGLIDRQEWDSAQERIRTFEKNARQRPNRMLAIRLGGSGDVTQSHVLWEEDRGVPEVPSPVCSDDRLFLVKNGELCSAGGRAPENSFSNVAWAPPADITRPRSLPAATFSSLPNGASSLS